MQPAPVYLALRVVPPPGFWQGLFAALTRWRLVTQYAHAGIVIDGDLVHSTLAHGVHVVPFDDPAGWMLLPLDVPPHTAWSRAQQRIGTRYDWISLLAFVLPLPVRWSKADYCFELCHYIATGHAPTTAVTAEQLAVVAAQQIARQLAEHNERKP
jgi:hypothetical protein